MHICSSGVAGGKSGIPAFCSPTIKTKHGSLSMSAAIHPIPSQRRTMSASHVRNEQDLSFITEELLERPAPVCSWSSLSSKPKLRALAEAPTKLRYHEVLGCGVDGVTFQTSLDEKTYAVNVVSTKQSKANTSQSEGYG